MGVEVLPCYVVCDVSSSMGDHVDELNAGLREFRGALHADPAAATLVRVCVIGFAAEPRVVQPLVAAADLAELPGPAAEAGTNYGPAFALLRSTVEHDVRGLKGLRLRVRRPVVFFASDGRPTDRATWSAAFAAFADPGWAARPTVVAYGLGAADHTTLGEIGTRGSYCHRGVRIGAALTSAVATTAARTDHV
jgi:uncharacterized protein YegL